MNLKPELVAAMTDSFVAVCQKRFLDVVYAGADRHTVLEWMARRPAGSLPDPRHTGYASLALWIDDIGEVVVEAWSGLATDHGALREQVFRGGWGSPEDFHPGEMVEGITSLMDMCLARVAAQSNLRLGRELPTEFVAVRGSDKSGGVDPWGRMDDRWHEGQ